MISILQSCFVCARSIRISTSIQTTHFLLAFGLYIATCVFILFLMKMSVICFGLSVRINLDRRFLLLLCFAMQDDEQALFAVANGKLEHSLYDKI